MSFDELELEAIIQEVLEECGEFENLDDEELYELIEKIKELTEYRDKNLFLLIGEYPFSCS